MYRRRFHRILKLPIIVFCDLFKILIVHMPGVTGVMLRRYYYGLKFKSCGKNLVVDVGVHIEGAELVSVGDDVFIDKYCLISTGKSIVGRVEKKENYKYLYGAGEIIIGSNVHLCQFVIIMGYGGVFLSDNVVLSSGCKIYSLTNTAYDLCDRSKVVSIMPYKNAPFLLSPVVLEKNVWFGLNTIAMPGVIVEKDSFCTSNSLLMGVYGENSYISGQPSKVTGQRFIMN